MNQYLLRKDKQSGNQHGKSGEEHTKGCEQEETWQVLLRERNTEKESWDLFLELGCANSNNMEGLLADMGENYPEMKAYFLRYKAEKLGYEDFFAGLEL